MLVIYWDCRDILYHLDSIRLILTRERPDLFILSNAWSYLNKGIPPIHQITSPSTPGSDPSPAWGWDQDNRPYKEVSYSKLARHSYAIVAIAREGVLMDSMFNPSGSRIVGDNDDIRLVSLETTDGFNIVAVCAPSHSQKPFKRQRRLDFDQRLLAAAALPLDRDTIPPPVPVLYIGNFQVAHTELDIHPFLVTPTQNLVNPRTRANFRSLLALGYYDMFRAFNPSGGYYNAFRQGSSDQYQSKNLGARTTYALAPHDLRERITRCWTPTRMGLTHYHPIAVYILPTDSSKGDASLIEFLYPQPGVSPSNPVRIYDSFALDIQINVNFPPYVSYAPTFQWFKDDTEISDNDSRFQNPFSRGYSSSVFSVYNAQPSDSGSYRVRVQNTFHTVWSEPIDIVVLDESNWELAGFLGPYQDAPPNNPYLLGE